jgi:hypothetical protein
MAEGSRIASLEDDGILKIIDGKDTKATKDVVSSEFSLQNKAVHKSVNTIRYQFIKYLTKERRLL